MEHKIKKLILNLEWMLSEQRLEPGEEKIVDWCARELRGIVDSRYDHLKCPRCKCDDYRTCKCGEERY